MGAFDYVIIHGDRDVPGEWRKAVMVPLYKGKGCENEWNNFRGISLFIARKINGIVV